MGRLVSQDEILKIVREGQKLGKTFVATNGCFDILHVGHVRYLQKTKALADYAIVMLNSDKSVDDFFEYLVRTVVIQEKFKYLTWIESSSGRYVGKLFYGLVNKDSFKIVPLI